MDIPRRDELSRLTLLAVVGLAFRTGLRALPLARWHQEPLEECCLALKGIWQLVARQPIEDADGLKALATESLDIDEREWHKPILPHQNPELARNCLRHVATAGWVAQQAVELAAAHRDEHCMRSLQATERSLACFFRLVAPFSHEPWSLDTDDSSRSEWQSLLVEDATTSQNAVWFDYHELRRMRGGYFLDLGLPFDASEKGPLGPLWASGVPVWYAEAVGKHRHGLTLETVVIQERYDLERLQKQWNQEHSPPIDILCIDLNACSLTVDDVADGVAKLRQSWTKPSGDTPRPFPALIAVRREFSEEDRRRLQEFGVIAYSGESSAEVVLDRLQASQHGWAMNAQGEWHYEPLHQACFGDLTTPVVAPSSGDELLPYAQPSGNGVEKVAEACDPKAYQELLEHLLAEWDVEER